MSHVAHIGLTICFIVCCPLGVWGQTDAGASHVREEVLTLAKEFETARVTLDDQMLRKLVHPAASYLGIRGRDSRHLLAELPGPRSRTSKPSQKKTEPVSVVNRRVVVHGNAAIVEEILGAEAGIAKGKKVIPRRRTVVWARTNRRWQIVHLHSSPYSRWENAITSYEAEDTPRPGGIVFIGSSSIRGWKTLHEDFPNHNVIGRGFGGSQMLDSVLYAHRVVLPYEPRAVAVYAGDNDIAAGKTPEQVFDDFLAFKAAIHTSNPEIRIGFIAIKPSPSRWHLWPTMKHANDLVEKFAQGEELVDFIDIATPMLDSDGMPRKSLFVQDGLHLTREGYQRWTSVVMPWARR